LIQSDDLDKLPTGITALNVQRPSRVCESENHATWTTFIIWVIFNYLTWVQYGLLDFSHTDIANNALIDSMFRKLELPLLDFNLYFFYYRH